MVRTCAVLRWIGVAFVIGVVICILANTKTPQLKSNGLVASGSGKLAVRAISTGAQCQDDKSCGTVESTPLITTSKALSLHPSSTTKACPSLLPRPYYFHSRVETLVGWPPCETWHGPIRNSQYTKFFTPELDKSCDWRPYPLNESFLASFPMIGDYTNIGKFLSSLRSGGSFYIMALGGSFTKGTSCNPLNDWHKNHFKGDPDCAWPARVQTWLGKSFPNAKIYLENCAQGGTTGSVLVKMLPEIIGTYKKRHKHTPDLVFIDTLVNDAYEVPTARKGRAYEALLTWLNRLLPKSLLLAVLASPCHKDNCTRAWNAQANQLTACQKHNIPTIDYLGEVVTRNGWRFFGPGNHAHAPVHQLVADVVTNALGRSLDDFVCKGQAGIIANHLSSASSSQLDDELSDYIGCRKHLRHYSAMEAFESRVKSSGPELDGDWKLQEDVKGKPGWIGRSPGSKIRFSVEFGDESMLSITWLRSYENMGQASVKVGMFYALLDGLWDPENNPGPVSQSFSSVFRINRSHVDDIQHSRKLYAEFEIHAAPSRETHKFKILAVTSC